MFYVQNWETLFPQSSAYDILKQQLTSAEKSLQSYDASTHLKRDSYLLTELSKIQKLVYLIEDQLSLLNQSPNDPSAINFLVNGKVEQLPSLKAGLKIVNHLTHVIETKIAQINNQFDSLANAVDDEELKQVLHQIRHIKMEEANLYGSQCEYSLRKVLECYSKYFNEDQRRDFETLASQQSAPTNKISYFNSFETKASNLLAEMRKDLRKGNHKLYYCIIENNLFHNKEGGKSPLYQGHAFVIEKTKDDQFRLYQSYDSQYSLKSYMASQLTEKENGLKSYVEFYPFLKALQKLENATAWNHEVNELYRQCFGVDHSTLLSGEVKQGFLTVSYKSMELEKEVSLQQEDSDFPLPSKNLQGAQQAIAQWIREAASQINPALKSIGLGSSFGALVSAVALSCIYAIKRVA